MMSETWDPELKALAAEVNTVLGEDTLSGAIQHARWQATRHGSQEVPEDTLRGRFEDQGIVFEDGSKTCCGGCWCGNDAANSSDQPADGPTPRG